MFDYRKRTVIRRLVFFPMITAITSTLLFHVYTDIYYSISLHKQSDKLIYNQKTTHRPLMVNHVHNGSVNAQLFDDLDNMDDVTSSKDFGPFPIETSENLAGAETDEMSQKSAQNVTEDVTNASDHQQIAKLNSNNVTRDNISPHKSCDFARYQNTLCLDCKPPRINKHHLHNCTAILYNRVPKCASSTMGYVFKKNSLAKNYTMFWLAKEFYTVTEKEKLKSMKLINGVENKRFLLIGHYYYYNFSDHYSGMY